MKEKTEYYALKKSEELYAMCELTVAGGKKKRQKVKKRICLSDVHSFLLGELLEAALKEDNTTKIQKDVDLSQSFNVSFTAYDTPKVNILGKKFEALLAVQFNPLDSEDKEGLTK